MREVTRKPASMGLSWQKARWTRVVPGRIGMMVLAAVPIALWLPLGSFGLFASWREGAMAILSIASLSLAIALGRDTAARQPAEFWIYQKGLSLADFAMGRWLLDTGFALAVMVVWLGAWSIGASMHGEIVSVRVLGASLLGMVSLFLMTTSLLFAVGATGSQRGTEYCFLFMLLAVAEPLLTRVMPPAAGLFLRVVLPPVLPAVNARILVATGETMRSVLPALLHVGVYTTALLGIGVWGLRRRTPDENG